MSRQRAVLSRVLVAKRSAPQTDQNIFSCVPTMELAWSLARISDHVLPDLLSTPFWEHIEDERICEETSWESLGKRFCGKKLGPRVVTLQDCVLDAFEPYCKHICRLASPPPLSPPCPFGRASAVDNWARACAGIGPCVPRVGLERLRGTRGEGRGRRG